ncbi:hypothetical protein [Leifsonia sp. NPDC080035]|uniref:Uncharacterized protein n=1 Tax=Leifsonia sp. NPDC080035 TaxID=3143936 RepID=A0AAU7GDI7_9MICO
MDDEIQLISDGDGLAVIGDPAAVDRFLAAEGLASSDLGLPRLGAIAHVASAGLQAGSEIAANSGRWVKLTEESAQLVKKYGLMKSKDSGLDLGVVYSKGDAHGIKAIVQFAKGPGAALTNPAILAGAAGIMAQLAMQQTMDEIIGYLQTIDEKVDDILRAQKDGVLSEMIAAHLVIEEAMLIRDNVGRVSEVTWSKVQTTSISVASTQMYALRQLDALAEKLENKAKAGDLAKAVQDAEARVREWLAVLARCFQLQDALAVLELDRVLDASPEELDRHRLGLRAARRTRIEQVSRSTGQLLSRVERTAARANAKVLLHPGASRSAVGSSEKVAAALADFHALLGIESAREQLTATRWRDAAADAKDKAIEAGADGVDAALRIGNSGVDRAKAVVGRLSDEVAERTHRNRGPSGRDG